MGLVDSTVGRLIIRFREKKRGLGVLEPKLHDVVKDTTEGLAIPKFCQNPSVDPGVPGLLGAKVERLVVREAILWDDLPEFGNSVLRGYPCWDQDQARDE